MILRKIKIIKKLIEKIFGKFCRCEEPIVLKKKPEPEVIKETVTAEPEKIKCNTHSRFKKSCPICVEASK